MGCGTKEMGGVVFLNGQYHSIFILDGNSETSKGETEDTGKCVGRMGFFWARGRASAHFPVTAGKAG